MKMARGLVQAGPSAVLLLAACSSDGERAGSSGSEGSDGGGPDAHVVVGPMSAEALHEGNRGLGCRAPAIDERVGAILEQMTLEQKVAEMHGLQSNAIDGLFYAGGDEALGIPPFKMTDGPRGVRARTATAFPVGMARGATFNPELERRVGAAMGLEVAAHGGNVLLAPTINLLRHPGWGRAQETYSEDSYHLGSMGVAFIAGAQRHVIASAKHFAVNSIENTRFTVSANLDERSLREVYLPHFERAVVEARVGSVMSAYNRVNGTYCAENEHLLSDILKGEWGFEGFVESDWVLGTRSTVPSARAGLDIEMPAPIYYGSPLLEAVRAGDVEEAAIDDSVRRILRQKLCFGLDAPPVADESVIASEEHTVLAREVAQEAMVLLRNEGNVLPLAAESVGKVAVVGALADVANLGDRGSSGVTPPYAVSPLAGLKNRAPELDFAAIPTDEPSEDDLQAIAAADVAIVVAGLTYREEGEFIPIEMDGEDFARGGDRSDLGLPAAQVAMIRAVAATARRTVVVLEGGSAIVVDPWIDDIDALVMAWYPGMEGGHAIADVLFGQVSPSGKLPVTFPRSVAQLPPWDIESDEVEYGYDHGYRLFDRSGDEPRYPFGFGLSYTQFELDRLSLGRDSVPADGVVTIQVDVSNVGDRVGAEVVQLYVGVPDSAVDRSVRELEAFHKVELQPAETKTVEFHLSADSLAYYDPASGDWVTEATEYRVWVGTSAADLPLSDRFTVE